MVALVSDQIREKILMLLKRGDFVHAKEMYDQYRQHTGETLWLIPGAAEQMKEHNMHC